MSLPTAEEVEAFARVVREAPVPIIADIHYEWRLALAAIECGAAGVRVNPGTLGEKHLREVVRAAAERDRVYGGRGEEVDGPGDDADRRERRVAAAPPAAGGSRRLVRRAR